MDLGEQIDTWMQSQDRWVPSAELEGRFAIRERQLRFDGGRPGLLSFNCISSAQGYKHIDVCTDAEFQAADHHDRNPLLSRFFVIRKRRQRRRALKTRPLVKIDRSGQISFL